MKNIFSEIPDACREEIFETILEAGNVLIERIVSEGQSTPAGEWLSPEKKEWVILLDGSAEISFEDDGSLCKMIPGDHLYIEGRRRHRVESTDPDRKTIWLAVHF